MGKPISKVRNENFEKNWAFQKRIKTVKFHPFSRTSVAVIIDNFTLRPRLHGYFNLTDLLFLLDFKNMYCKQQG
jgi:hypothetical protein